MSELLGWITFVAFIIFYVWHTERKRDKFLGRIKCELRDCENNERGFCSAENILIEEETIEEGEDNYVEKPVCRSFIGE